MSKETKAAPVKGEWFRDAKFAMFMHWGLYSQAAGVWNGKRYHGIGEWLMHRAGIPRGGLRDAGPAVQPGQVLREQRVRLAQDAGMKYIVITAKHHDGFAMFQSEASAVQHRGRHALPPRPAGRAGRGLPPRRGIRLGFYYSQYQDWHEPDGGGQHLGRSRAAATSTRYFDEKCAAAGRGAADATTARWP